MMTEPIEIRSGDDILKNVKYKIYGNKDKRIAIQFLPEPNEPQTQEIEVPWGDKLTVKPGDYIVRAAANPNDCWPVEKGIFEQSYQEEEPGSSIFKKTAVVALVPLTDFTGGDPDRLVTIYSLEGKETVPAGKYHLARGIKGEIWAFPSENIEGSLYEMD